MSAEVAVVFGTRPEIIKVAPILHILGDRAEAVFTGQHYDANLRDAIFSSAGLAAPRVQLTAIGGQDRADQVNSMLVQLTAHFRQHRPRMVIVQGDTNSANAGAQAAHYLGIPVLHVEAGLRSFDRAMPEEINRLVIGAIADVHCCATEANAHHLLAAGVPPHAVKVTGNTIVEATLATMPEPERCREIQQGAGLVAGEYILATIHRPENVDDFERLAQIVGELHALNAPVLFPMHPRTRHRAEAEGLTFGSHIEVIEPVDHPTFLALAAGARLLVSDSGGVQEEVTVLGKPLVVVRNSTERPESVEAGFAILTRPVGIAAAAHRLLRPGWAEHLAAQPSPFGDGTASEQIASIITRYLETGDLTAATGSDAANAGGDVLYMGNVA